MIPSNEKTKKKNSKKSLFDFCRLHLTACHAVSGHRQHEATNTSYHIGWVGCLCRTLYRDGGVSFPFWNYSSYVSTHASHENNNNNNNTNYGGQKGCVFTNFHRTPPVYPGTIRYTLYAVSMTDASRAVCDVV